MAAPVTSRTRLRVGVVGAGLIAQVMHLHYLRELSDCFEIAGLCDIDLDHARAVAQRFEVDNTFSDWRELLDQDLDCVLVLTSGSHAPVAIEAAKRGIHVLVEKPMCFSSAEGQKMVDAAAQADVRLMVAYNKRYDPAYLRFVDEVAELPDARLMRVTTFESPFQPYVSHYPLAPVAHPPAQAMADIQAESEIAIGEAIGDADEFARKTYRWVLLDTLVHELNGVRGVLGEPDRLDYVDFRQGTVSVMLDFAGMPVAIHWIDLPGITRYKMEFAAYAPDRRVTLSFPSPFLRSEPTLLQIEDGDVGTPRARLVEEINSYESPFKRELLAFHECVTAGTSPPTPGTDALRDITLCERIVESFRTRLPIEQPSLPH
jgi:predicted dehydrogenase